MSMILLALAGIMNLAGRTGQSVVSEAQAYEAQAGGDGRFVPRDLIRLCQFIEVWIPQ